MAETTHQVQKAFRTKDWMNIKYMEKAKPKITIAGTIHVASVPANVKYVPSKIATYIKSPKYGFGMPKVLLNLLCWTFWHHSFGKNQQVTSVFVMAW